MTRPTHQDRDAHHPAIEEMVEALEAEIEATRKRRGRSWTAIGTGTRAATSSGEALYRFGGVGHLSYRAGHLVQLQAGKSEMTARVVALQGGTLTLACPRDVGPRLGPARVYRDPSWLLVAQRRALRSLSSMRRQSGLLLEPWKARVSQAPLSNVQQPAVDGLNDDQEEAVRMAVGSELSYVWGPPGTGKTTTLARVAEALHRGGESVLVVAPTNQAVDHLLMTVADRLAGDPALKNGEVLRLGPIQSGELRRRFGQHVDLQRLARARSRAPASKHVRAIKQLLRRLPARDPSDPALPELRRRLEADLRRLQSGRPGRQVRRHAARRQLLGGARIVATTLHRACLLGQLHRSFDAVVVDEMSSASFPLVFLAAALRARRRMVVGGDFRQLPPVVKANDSVARRWLGRDAFEVGRLVEVLDQGTMPEVLSPLIRQYRMHPQIGRLVSSYAYGGRLQTAGARIRQPSDTSRRVGSEPLLLIDTGPFRAKLVPGEGETRRRANPVHGLVVGHLLEELLGEEANGSSAPSVAVLSPYNDQVAAHRERFGQSHNAHFLTVHKAQGQEFDVVILDLPSASGVQPSPFARATSLADTGARLLNVGASRAREQLVVVADCDYYGHHGLSGAAVGQFLASVEAEGRRVSCHRLVRSLPTSA